MSCPWGLVRQGNAQGLQGTPYRWWKHGGSTDGITDLVTRPCAVAAAVMIEGVGGVAAAPGRLQPVPMWHCLQCALGLSWMVDFRRLGVALVAALPAERRQQLRRPAEKGRLHPGV